MDSGFSKERHDASEDSKPRRAGIWIEAVLLGGVTLAVLGWGVFALVRSWLG